MLPCYSALRRTPLPFRTAHKLTPSKSTPYIQILATTTQNSNHCWHTTRLRRYSTGTRPETNNTDVSHAEFIAESSSSNWKEGRGKGKSKSLNGTHDTELDSLQPGKGKLSPTSSHLFKLILPLGLLKIDETQRTVAKRENGKQNSPPTVLLLHPSQPLSHVSRLILASLAPATPNVSFRSAPSSSTMRQQEFQWSHSTDVGDFIRDAARHSQFRVCIGYEGTPTSPDASASETSNSNSASAGTDNSKTGQGKREVMLDVEVPTVADRTRYLRRRLDVIGGQLKGMEALKSECDREARRGARRMATAGFGALAVYWGAVARLTFWDYGWDVMEPITYLSGLSTVMAGYLWFLYQGREVTYSSVLDRSISARREQLYKTRGFDIEQWMDLVTEARSLRSEIRKISEDYAREDEDDEQDEGEGEREFDELGEGERKKRQRKKDLQELGGEGGSLRLREREAGEGEGR
ncbi:hypothetical protein R3P38DRAFT_319785 [Favolaschia claudopus]|uniref:Calcium uniporter protein, mitochondrial n=1 Tax=Favolaschia claudopus TaxID=2862362 RepID=A0AAW0CW56_9AGAR